MKWMRAFCVLALVSLTACSALTANARPVSTTTPVPATATATLEPSATPAPTDTPQPTNTPEPTLTPTWVFNQPGHATAPILLYHHIADIEPANRYYVPPAVFQQQMLQLKALDYTPIPLSLLVKALTTGADLPARPVVITFDDGDADVYQNAFPVMRALGFPGTMFLVANRMNAEGFFSPQMANEMIATGWEMGSHSFSHQNLKEDHSLLDVEVRHSKEVLDQALQAPVMTFAYPFGEMDADVANAVYTSGFQAAVGLGGGYEHSMSTLYYLLRNEVTSDLDMNGFIALLPWK